MQFVDVRLANFDILMSPSSFTTESIMQRPDGMVVKHPCLVAFRCVEIMYLETVR